MMKLCLEDGCRNLTRGTRCTAHQTIRNRKKVAGQQAYRQPGWKALRLRVLARDGYQCQMRLPGCTEVATTVDHMDAASLVGPGLPPDSRCRAACLHCNSADGARLTNEIRRKRGY